MTDTDFGHELPLFDTYAIHVEFEKRWMELDAMLSKSAASADGSTLVDRIRTSLTLEPLELLKDRMSVRPIFCLSRPDRPDGYEYHVPYQGDGELWRLLLQACQLVGGFLKERSIGVI